MISVADAVQRINVALESKKTIVFCASCQVSYSGRAESYLPLGDRIFIIKPDGTLLIHQYSGSNPINYMKSGSVHRLTERSGSIFLHSSNIPNHESLQAEILYFHFVECLDLQDGANIQLVGTEKDMADLIMKQPDLIEKGFRPFSREEHTKYGFIDVFGTDSDGNIVVIECKRYQGDFKAVSQLERYVVRLKIAKGVANVRGILACPKISPNALLMLEDKGFSWVSVDPPKYLERFKSAQKNIFEFSEKKQE